MPGFKINGIGGDGNYAKGTERYYYTYSWEILGLFGTGADRDSGIINAKDMSLPTISISKESVQGSVLEYKYAKSVVWEDIRITWYDTVGFIDTIMKWRKSVWRPDIGLQPASVYKRDSLVSYYPPDREDPDDFGAPTGTVTYKLVNSWPSIIKHGDLTYTSSDAKIVEVTLTYDWAEEVK